MKAIIEIDEICMAGGGWGVGRGVAYSAGVFFERAICSRKCHVETSYRNDYYFYFPQSSTVINSKIAATTIHYEREQGFAHPKYACTAG